MRPVDRVYQSLYQKIMNGEYSPAETLIETNLVNEYNVSHNTVKKALLMLLSEGLIDMEPNKSARVTSCTAKDVLDTIDLGLLLLPYNVRLTVPVINDTVLMKLRNALEEMENLYRRQDYPSYGSAALRYLMPLYTACPNRISSEIAVKLMGRISRYYARLLSLSACMERILHNYRTILTALEHRDAEAAAEAVTAGIMAFKEDFLRSQSIIL